MARRRVGRVRRFLKDYKARWKAIGSGIMKERAEAGKYGLPEAISDAAKERSGEFYKQKGRWITVRGRKVFIPDKYTKKPYKKEEK